jgi:hypothetical protein
MVVVWLTETEYKNKLRSVNINYAYIHTYIISINISACVISCRLKPVEQATYQ